MSNEDNSKISWDSDTKDVEVAVIGGGSMGSGMTLLFASHGSVIGAYDKLSDPVKATLRSAPSQEPPVDSSKLHGFSTLQKLIGAFKHGQPRVVVFSLPHGKVVDDVLGEIGPLMNKGDVIVDGGNEFFDATERRQKKAQEWGVHFIGCGVSGGYQAARRGPSMSAGGDPEAYKIVEPLLKKWAAKTPEGESCVGLMGPGGSGNYVKMVHNGIEQAHLSIFAEVRALLRFQLGLTNFQIADIFEKWTSEGELGGNYLLDIGHKTLRFTKGDGVENEEGIVESIEDKVTQDVDNSEGTGVWTNSEIGVRHVAAPSISAAHQLRIISADRTERLKVVKNLNIPQPSKSIDETPVDEMVEIIRKATYGAVLGAFIMGLNLIARASEDEGWNVDLSHCIKVWRAGCIIRSTSISSFLLPHLSSSSPLNLLLVPEIAKPIADTYPALKEVVHFALHADAVVPALSASLEWVKSCGGKDLPTNFEEMQLDTFGAHRYDRKGDELEGTKKGPYHTEFIPA